MRSAALAVILVRGLALILLVGGTATAAEDMSRLYDTATLQYWQGRYSRSTERILVEGILPRLPAEQQRTLRSVRLDFPLRHAELISFYAEAPPPTITLPVSALKFLDDLSIAYAWLWRKGYRLEAIEEYVAMLKYKRPQDFPGGRYPAPRPALGVPDDALDASAVNALSLRFFNSARAFILAHELGHLYHRHPGGRVTDEEEADRFALEVMRRTGTVPMGVLLYFQATALWSRNRADYASDEEWERFLRREATHPLTARRVRALAEAVDRLAPAYARNEPDPEAGADTMRFIGRGMRKVADYLDDQALQQCVARHASRADPRSLAPRASAGPSPLDC